MTNIRLLLIVVYNSQSYAYIIIFGSSLYGGKIKKKLFET